MILHVRADEAYHAIYNHGLSNQIRDGGIDRDTIPLEGDIVGKTASGAAVAAATAAEEVFTASVSKRPSNANATDVSGREARIEQRA